MSRKRTLPNRGTKRWSVRHHGCKRKLRRATGMHWDFNGDGVFWHERIPGDERRRWRKWLDRTALAQELNDVANELEQDQA